MVYRDTDKKNLNQSIMKKIIIVTFFVFLQIGLYAQNGNYTDVNGVKIYYETYGKGQPLVLLHYFSASHLVWEQWIDSLSKDYQLIIPDLRGQGNSTNPSKIYRHKDVAQDIYSLMDELKITNFKAIGASSGAMTLIHMATIDTTRILSMILTGAISYYPEQARQFVKNLTFESYSEDDLSWLRKHNPQGDDQLKMLIDQFRNQAFIYDDMNFTPPYLSQIKCPTLIIHGGKDEYFPIDIPVEMHNAIPNSYLWIIPNGGHLPIWKELWSDQFLKVSKLFLEDKL